MAHPPGLVRQYAADGLHWIPRKLKSQRDDLHCLFNTEDRLDEGNAIVTSLMPSLEVYAKAALQKDVDGVVEGHCTRAVSRCCQL